MRLPLALAVLAGPLAAQPLALDATPHPRTAVTSHAEAAEAEHRNVLLVEGGGMSVGASVRYERRLFGPIVGTVGFLQTGLGGEGTARIVPVGAMVVHPIGGHWRADLGASVAVLSRGETWAAPAVSAGVRYERARLHLRLGASLVGVRDAPGDVDAPGWNAAPWPAASAGVRF